MKERLKAPELRFPGFTDDWVENQLGSLIKIERQQEIKKEKLTDTPEGYYVLAMRTFSKEGYIDFSKPYWIKSDIEDKDAFLLPGEFAIIDADMDVSLPKIGKVLINSYNKKFLLAAHVRKVNVQNNVNSYFMYGVMRTDHLLRRLKKEASGSIAQGLLDKNIYKQNVYIPAIFEQAKIGLFLKEFENIIALHQRKLDLLKEQKKGYLQKMFPKNGEKVPELRFAGFADDWEERKFSDFTKLSQGLQIAISDRFTEAGPNKEFYITNEFLNPNNTKKYYIENPSKNVIANTNDILMTRTGNTGKVVTNTKGAFHNNFFKIDYDPKKISKLFLYFLLTSIPIQKEILIRAGTSTIPDLNHKDFYKIKVYLPIFEEQQRIGSFFKQLDDTIALHQRKLDLLKEQKKGFLQKMFV